MTHIYICSAEALTRAFETLSPQWLVSVTVPSELPQTPTQLARENHLRLACHDIVVATDGAILPDESHVRRLMEFARRWKAQADLLVHCSAGVSRSSAAALIIACAVYPAQVNVWAERLRLNAPHTEPNRRLIAIADRLLSLDSALVDAVHRMGSGRIQNPAPLGCLSLAD